MNRSVLLFVYDPALLKYDGSHISGLNLNISETVREWLGHWLPSLGDPCTVCFYAVLLHPQN